MRNCDFNMLPHGCSPVNLQHIFRTPFFKNTSGGCFYILMFHIITILPRFTYIWKRIISNNDHFAANLTTSKLFFRNILVD